ncbi:MAG: RNA polymerase sigma factor [Acidobacteria bacterium]|nr:RNA polymerase sigma factor [Acidobacteriota bacterium]
MDEAKAIRLCLRHRDPAGFEFLVKKYRREAFFHAFALMGNREDAADACQESFRRAFTSIPNLVSLDCFYPWFYRILRNCCLNMLSRQRTILNHAGENRMAGRVAGTTAGPESILSRKEEAAAVHLALNSLDAEAREILSLKYILGNCYEEIARLLGVPRGTVMSRLFHARKAFREEYLRRSKPDLNGTKGEHHE